MRGPHARSQAWGDEDASAQLRLIKRLSYKTQELVTGLKLSAESERRIESLSADEPIRQREPDERRPPLPAPQTEPRNPRLPPPHALAGAMQLSSHGSYISKLLANIPIQ